MKRSLMKLMIVVSILPLYFSEEQNVVYNTCGFSSTEEPNTPSDCTKHEIELGGNCCYIRYQKNADVEVENNYQSYSACLAIPSNTEQDISLAIIAASTLSYTASIICSHHFICFYYIVTFTFILFLI